MSYYSRSAAPPLLDLLWGMAALLVLPVFIFWFFLKKAVKHEL